MSAQDTHALNLDSRLKSALRELLQRVVQQGRNIGLDQIDSMLDEAWRELRIAESLSQDAANGATQFKQPVNFFQHLLETMPHFVIGLDEIGRCVAYNALFAELARNNQKTEPGFNFNEIVHAVAGGDPLEMHEVLQQTAAIGLWNGDIWIQRGTGSRMLVNASIFNLVAENPATQPSNIRYAAILLDISGHRKMEQDFLHQEVMRGVALLAGGVAHNLNNLLVGVQGYAALLKPMVKDDERAQKYLSIIDRSSSKAADLSKQLLRFSQRDEATPIEVDPNSAIEEGAQLASKLIGPDIEIILELQPQAQAILVDPGHLDMILLELCINASHAIKKEGRITIRTASSRVPRQLADSHPQIDPQKTYLCVSVADTGSGIDPKQLNDIFQPFVTSREFQARGLGLSMVYGLVNRYDGAIAAESGLGKGTTINVYLPFVPSETKGKGRPEMEQQEQSPIEPQPKSNSKTLPQTPTLLIVDDEAVVLEFFDNMLKNESYNVLFASNGEEALEMFRRAPDEIDLVFMDLIMPRKDGLQTLLEMRELRPDIKVVLTSGYVSNRSLDELVKNGEAEFMHKPFSVRDFFDMIDRQLYSSRP
ncbi:response regulator [Candidatus Sumerlaeota bacterium]|nr:response regulator [Candidatus Sumerlaeota bacterium]